MGARERRGSKSLGKVGVAAKWSEMSKADG